MQHKPASPGVVGAKFTMSGALLGFMYAVVFALVLPSIITWLYFIALADSDPVLQQATYVLGKTAQFLLPIIWVLLYKRQRLTRPKPLSDRAVLFGLAFGVSILIVAALTYHWYLKPSGVFDQPSIHIKKKLLDLGGGTAPKYWLLSTFYVIVHSFFEEYYWRWFVAAELRARWSEPAAISISSLGFTAHHLLVLAYYFGWTSPFTYVFSVCVMTGGIAWAWLYFRSKSLIAPWLSHLLVDLAIFIIGYDIVRTSFTAT
jgi:membrane protease YdiL (CAAX protease family)